MWQARSQRASYPSKRHCILLNRWTNHNLALHASIPTLEYTIRVGTLRLRTLLHIRSIQTWGRNRGIFDSPKWGWTNQQSNPRPLSSLTTIPKNSDNFYHPFLLRVGIHLPPPVWGQKDPTYTWAILQPYDRWGVPSLGLCIRLVVPWLLHVLTCSFLSTKEIMNFSPNILTQH